MQKHNIAANELTLAETVPISSCTLKEYIENALYHPDTGYYGSAKVNFGPDFETYAVDWAPLLAERFLLAREAMLAEHAINELDTFYIYEFGAGIGTMALTILKYIHGKTILEPESAWVNFYNSLKYIIGEFSPALLLQQKHNLKEYAARGKIEFYQIDARKIDDTLPRGAGIVISNELIDAFPPHEITVDGESIFATIIETADGKHARKLLPAEQVLTAEELAFLQETLLNAKELIKPKTQFYLHTAIEDYFKKIASFLIKGFILTLDYGRDACNYFSELEDLAQLRTFSHQHGNGASILEHPGELDITCEINFSDLVHIGEKFGLELTYFGVQDALGGAYAPQFRVLIQNRGLNPVCGAKLCRDMRISSPVRYKDMPKLSSQLSELHLLLANLQQQLDDSSANNVQEPLEKYFDWLIQHNYSNRDRAFMAFYDEAFTLQLLILFRTMIVTDNENQRAHLSAQFTPLLQNIEYVELFLQAIAHYTQKIVSEKIENEYEEHAAGSQIFFRILELFRSLYPELTEYVLNLEALREYNFITSLKPEQSQQTLVSRCLYAAEKACYAAIQDQGVFSERLQLTATQSLHESLNDNSYEKFTCKKQ